MDDLKARGSEKTRRIYVNHGLPADRMYGVSNADLKLIAKTIKREQALAMELYATGNVDAMYLAGLVADGAQMTRKQLQVWAEGANGMPMIAEHTVPWVTVENKDAVHLATHWIASKREQIACSGWCTWSGIVATRPDSELDLAAIETLLRRVPVEIGGARNRVKSAMNSFVISVGIYVRPLRAEALDAAAKMGTVAVDVGDTACKVPIAAEYIAKAEAAGKVGKKLKTIRC
jgi:3-methyladenine DNA glycosylase AlkD